MQVKIFDQYILDSDAGTIYSEFLGRNLKPQFAFKSSQVSLRIEGKTKTLSLPNLFFETFIGPVGQNQVVRFYDLNPENLNINNLYLEEEWDSKVWKFKRLFSKEDIEQVCELYEGQGQSMVEIAAVIKTTDKKVLKILKSENITIRPRPTQYKSDYSLNHDYFSKIDTDEKAYLLGFMGADGHIDSRNNVIGIGINDIDLLERFMEIFKLKGKGLYDHPSNSKVKVLRFSSRKMKDDLICLGCTPRKSFTLEFPTESQVPKHLWGSYIRGNFDGDGSISVFEKRSKSKASFCGSTLFCTKLKSVLEEFGIRCSKVYRSKGWKMETARFEVYGIEPMKKLKDLMYGPSTIHLDRKFKRFEML